MVTHDESRSSRSPHRDPPVVEHDATAKRRLRASVQPPPRAMRLLVPGPFSLVSGGRRRLPARPHPLRPPEPTASADGGLTRSSRTLSMERIRRADGGCRNPAAAKHEVLAHFGSTPGEARRALAAWMRTAASSTSDEDQVALESSRSTAGTEDDGPALNDRIGWEPSGVLEPIVSELRANRLREAGWTLDVLIDWACRRLDADPVAVRAGRRTLRESRARAVVAILPTRDLRLQLERVARATGVTSAGAFRASERGARYAADCGIQLDESGPP